MKATVEPLEGNKVKLSVEIDEQEFDKAIDTALRKIAREVRIPGFRPGKAPRRLLEARMGAAGVRQEAMREALPEFYAEAVRQAEVDAIAPPEIDITSGEESGALAFDAVVEVRPTVAIPGYQGLQVTIPSVEVTDEEIQRQLDRLRQPFGELVDVDRPATDGDHVTLDLSGERNGEAEDALSAEDFLYEVGSSSVVPELDDELRGAKVGDIRTFDTTLGDDTLSFRALVKAVKELQLPELTDEWAQEASEFDTLDELVDDLRTRMATVKKVQASMSLRDAAVGALVELVTEDAPDPLVNEEMERRIHDLAHRLEQQGADLGQYLAATGQDQQSFVDELRVAAVQAVKGDLALRALAQAEHIEVTDDDVEEELARLAERFDTSPQQLRQQLERADQMPAVRSDLRKAKALGWLVEHVGIVDEAGNPVDREALTVDLDRNDEATDETPTAEPANENAEEQE